MAIDPESIGVFIGAVLTSVGASWGGSRVLEKRKQANAPDPEKPQFCQEHHKCFTEIKDAIGDVKTDVAYIRGVIDRGIK